MPDYLPAVPRDPFADRPLQLIQRAGVVTLYSVGKDAVDDGGSTQGRAAGQIVPTRGQLRYQGKDFVFPLGRAAMHASTQTQQHQ